jgi:hypothetical protein
MLETRYLVSRHYSRQLSKHFQLLVVLRPCNRASYYGNIHTRRYQPLSLEPIMPRFKGYTWNSHGSINIAVFLNVTPCCLTVYCLFGRTYCLSILGAEEYAKRPKKKATSMTCYLLGFLFDPEDGGSRLCSSEMSANSTRPHGFKAQTIV